MLDSLWACNLTFCCISFTPESRFKAKHSLDSDEEDDMKEEEKEGLGDEDLAAQEDTTIVCDIHPHLHWP